MIFSISFKEYREKAVAAVARFPWALFVAALGTVMGMVSLQENLPGRDEAIVLRILLALVFAVPLCVSMRLYAEESGAPRKVGLLLPALALPLAAAFFLTLPPPDRKFYDSESLRSALFILAAYTSVFVFPFLKQRNRINAFWRYCYQFFARLFLTIIYTGILYAGIAIIFATLDYLFDINVDSRHYQQLWIFIAGIVAHWFFLAGFPHNSAELQNETRYPNALKIFFHTIALPLVVIYALILYIYGGTMLTTWDWSKDSLATLILGFSCAGVIAYALAYPRAEHYLDPLAAQYKKWFFVLLLPLIALLFGAIGIRLNEYGVTENRYFVVVFGGWLFAVSLYFIFSRSKNLVVIPITLFVLIILSAIGPLSAFSLSLRSQLGRLENILIKNSLLADGFIKDEFTPKTIPEYDHDEVNAITRYIAQHHGFGALQKWFKTDLNEYLKDESRYYQSDKITKLMGLEYKIKSHASSTYFSLHSNNRYDLPFDIQGYDYVIREISDYKLKKDGFETELRGRKFLLKYDPDEGMLRVLERGRTVLTADINKTAEDLRAKYEVKDTSGVNPEQLSAVYDGQGISFKLYFSSLYGEKKKEGLTEIRFTATAAFKLK